MVEKWDYGGGENVAFTFQGYFCERAYDDDQAENCRGNSLPELRS